MLTKQEAYRQRLVLKARHFDEWNDARMRDIRRQAGEIRSQGGDSAELRMLLPYFLSNPAMRTLPDVRWDETIQAFHWSSDAPDRTDTVSYLTAAFRELSSAPFEFAEVGDGSYGPSDESCVKRAAEDIKTLRDLGMWVTE